MSRFTNAAIAMCATLLVSSVATTACCPKKILWKDKPAPATPPVVVEPEDLKPPKPMPNRAGLPSPAAAEAWAPPAIGKWKMANGMTVWHLQQSQTPLISLTLMLPNGAGSDPKGKAGTTQLMVDMLDEGVTGLSGLELGKSWQRLATDYGASATVDTTYFSLNMLADKLGASLDLLNQVLRKPTFDKAEFARRKSLMTQSALAGEASPSTGRSNVLRRVLQGKGYAGASPSGSKSTLPKVKLSDVKRRYKDVIHPAGAHVIVVGDVDKDSLTAALNKTFGDWSGTPKAKLLAAATTPLERGIHIVDYPGASQSSIAVARRSPVWSAKDQIEKMLMNRVLGGMFTSRLNMNLREDKGYSYGAGSMFMRRKHSGAFLAYAGVKAETTVPSLKEIEMELLSMATGKRPITAKEFTVAKSGLLFGYPSKYETFSNVTAQILPMAQHSLPEDWLKSWPDKVRNVTVDIANAEALKLLVKADGTKAASVWDEFVIVVAGPRAKLEAELKTLGLPIHAYDAEGNRLKTWAPAAEKK